MLEKFKYIMFILCNMLIGCLAGWLLIYATPLSAILLILAYIVSLLIFDENYKA